MQAEDDIAPTMSDATVAKRPAPHSAHAVAEPDATPSAPDPQVRPQRTFRQKLIGIRWTGWLRLAVICIAVGAVLEAGGINPFAPDFTAAGALAALGHGLVSILSWIVNAGWRPLLVGAMVVVPIWLLWRLATVPFRK